MDMYILIKNFGLKLCVCVLTNQLDYTDSFDYLST
jgi:hypothetical protein